jgi:hypothetical protein
MFEKIVESERAKEILGQYMAKFIKPDYTPWNMEYNCPDLPWCHFKVGINTLDISNIPNVNIPSDKIVYCHDEKQKELYQTKYKNVFDLIKRLEPWEEVDIEIFDDSMDWTMAITHEGEIILYGVEIVV